MSTCFPLYTTLSKSLKKKDLKEDQKKFLIKTIEKMDTDAHELVFALIRCYHTEHTKEKNVKIPYKGEEVKSDISFDLSDLPNQLRHLLHKFAVKYSEKIKEDETLEKTQQSIEERNR